MTKIESEAIFRKYKQKKEFGLFMNYIIELEYISDLLDEVIDYMISFDNHSGSAEYREAQGVYHFFNPRWAALDERFRREEHLRKMRERLAKNSKKYWDKNGQSINKARIKK